MQSLSGSSCETGTQLNLRRAAPQRSLPPCGGGTGRGIAAHSEIAATPLPTPPPQGGREQAVPVAPSCPYSSPSRLQPCGDLLHQGVAQPCMLDALDRLADEGLNQERLGFPCRNAACLEIEQKV